MATIADHYENLLASHYSWMFGNFESKLEANRQFFRTYGIVPQKSAIAVDLGAGPGFQSIPLAEAGFTVTAVDLSGKLLAELWEHAGTLQIATVQGDLISFRAHISEPVGLVVCMGDTLTHLESFEQLRTLFAEVQAALEPGGNLVLTFRDLTHELTGADRFIPVRSDDNTIFTCFLEYEPERVKVHDLVYVRNGEKWELHKSWYPKMRLSMERARQLLAENGLSARHAETVQGMVTIVAVKGE